MKDDRFKKYLKRQVKEIEEHKWLLSEKAGKDLGDVAVLDYVKKYAKKFRRKIVLEDLTESLAELKIIKKKARGSKKGRKFLKFILDCIEKTSEAVELLETNGNGGGK